MAKDSINTPNKLFLCSFQLSIYYSKLEFLLSLSCLARLFFNAPGSKPQQTPPDPYRCHFTSPPATRPFPVSSRPSQANRHQHFLFHLPRNLLPLFSLSTTAASIDIAMTRVSIYTSALVAFAAGTFAPYSPRHTPSSMTSFETLHSVKHHQTNITNAQQRLS